ncbi:MAG: thioredoxin family protein [Burkholderiaceae bacterium]
MPADATPPTWLVACLCAAWCRTCGDYRAVLAAAERSHPEARFAWVDIEDHADALDDPDGAAEDIENFPTLLLSLGDAPYFCGTVLPHASVLERLLEQARSGALSPMADPVSRHLARAVGALVRQGLPALRVG